MDKNKYKIVERGFKVLQQAYPKKIDDDFKKVKENQYFKDFLKVCAIILTFGLAALSEKTTLQSTKNENFSKFQKLVKDQKSKVYKKVCHHFHKKKI